MMRLRCDFLSETLQQSTSMTVLLPQTVPDASAGVPVLYLLHGLSDDETCWERRSSLERYAEEAGLAVVMPAAHRSFYCNEVLGERYWDFVSQELPALVSSSFNVSTSPERTFVAGLSMGGYGALKLALRHPERYAAVGAFSPVTVVSRLADRHPDLVPRVWGAQGASPKEDIRHLLQQVGSAAPRIWLSCGTEDVLLEEARDVAGVASELGVDLHAEWPAGDHEWDVWDTQIARFIPWACPGLGER